MRVKDGIQAEGKSGPQFEDKLPSAHMGAQAPVFSPRKWG